MAKTPFLSKSARRSPSPAFQALETFDKYRFREICVISETIQL